MTSKSPQLILVFTERRKLGLTVIPYLASEMLDEPKIELHEQLTTERIATSGLNLNESEKQLIRALEEISDQRLHKKFSKEKNVKQFFDNLTHELIEKRIRPEIEKRIQQCFNILTDLPNLPVFYKNTTYSHLYLSDRVKIANKETKAIFNFDLLPDAIYYRLKIWDEEREFGLLNRELLFITHEPCSFLLNHKLYRFIDIDSSKIKPFLSKSAVVVPTSSVKSYMQKFVLNCIRDYHVQAKGFEIKDKSGSPSTILSVEQDLNQLAVLTLKFRYAHKNYLSGTNSKAVVELIELPKGYEFNKIDRHLHWEADVITKLNNMGLELLSGSYYRPKTNGSSDNKDVLAIVVEWLSFNQKELVELGITIEQKFFPRSYFTGKTVFTSTVQEVNDWFEVRIRVEIGTFRIPFVKFRKHLINKTREFELPDGSIFIIPTEWFTRFSELLPFTKNSDDDTLVVEKMHYNLLKESGNKLNAYHPLDITLEALSATQLTPPNSLKATLRPYQAIGYSWMMQLSQNNLGGILADDMGLGKTLQTITTLLHQYESATNQQIEPTQLSLFDSKPIQGFNAGKLAPSLIVMPTSLLHNWESEIKRFAPSLKIYMYTGQQRIRSKEVGKILKHYHVILTSYGLLRNDIEFLSTIRFHYLILDESQNIKNPSSKIYEAVMELQGSHRLTLTGTPIENSLTDLWAQMNFANKGILGSLNFFKNKFATAIEKFKSEEREKQLQVLIQPFILRRTKDAVAKDLPPLTEQTIYCDMTPEQQKVYEREKSGIRNELLKVMSNPGKETGLMALQALTRLRQLAIHPKLIDENYEGSSGKYEQIIENLSNVVEEKHKVLVFSAFVKDLELIEKEINARKWQYAKLTGSTIDRAGTIAQFTNNDECRIFLISLKAGGVGLNLTQADYVFMLNPWWNPAAEAQAINRAHRIGQTKSVFVYKFISSGTIEEKIARLQEKKSLLAETFINSNNPFKNLSSNEIKELFA